MAGQNLTGILAERLSILDGVPAFGMDPPAPEDMQRFMEFYAPVPGYAVPRVRTRDVEVPGPHGPIPARVYEPEGGKRPRLGLVWMHGGAFVGGDLEMPEVDQVARELVSRIDAVVVSPAYRLCQNGIHFPVPHDDVYAVYVWATRQSGLTSDGAPWSIGGGSAGGNLAGGVAQRLRDEGQPPAAEILAYPVMHDPLPADSAEHQALMASLPPALRFRPESTAHLNSNYLGDQSPDVPYALPGRGRLAGLPRTLIILCEFDDLLPSGLLYAAQLHEAGVPTEVEFVRGVTHGHLNFPGLPEAIASIDRIAGFLTQPDAS
jgi:acetyl esterase